MNIRVGVDNYSYHRLLGEVRPGEIPSGAPPWTWQDTIRSARISGADLIALETCFIPDPASVRPYARNHTPSVMLSWGHPYGLEYGTSAAAEKDLHTWMALASELDARRMRIVVAHPALRKGLWTSVNRRRTVEALGRTTERARELGLELQIENHADLTARELAEVIAEVGASNLGVCFDIANAVRVGDEALEAARILAPLTTVMHVKDVDLTLPYGVTGPRSVALGSGSLPVREAIGLMRRESADLWLLVEVAQIGPGAPPEEEWVARDIAWIRAQL